MDHRLRERLLLAAAGGAWGLALWLLTETEPQARAARAAVVAAATFLAVTALVFHFAWTGEARRRLLALTVGTGALYAAVAAWVGGSLSEGPSASGDAGRAVTWVLASGVTLYVLGPFLQIFQRSGRVHFPYRELFLHGWNNFFVALVGVVFTGALWAVLLLWAALFDLVGIEWFEDLFTEAAFAWPVTGAAAGFGVALGRESDRVVGTLRGITLAVFRGLLPLVCFVALIFLATLPFTGLEGLWDTDHASPLLCTWVALTILFLNAVYQDGSDPAPLSAPLRRLVEAGLLAMTAYVAISAWGVSLRIGQYGLTPRRLWMVLLLVVLGAYAGGYALAVLRRGTPWLRAIRGVNLGVALLVVAIGLLAHTPLLDPVTWSARSQFARLAEGRVPADAFDYGTLRFRLGRAGAARFEALSSLEGHPEIATIRAQVARARAADHYWEWQQASRSDLEPDRFERAGGDPPEALLRALRSDAAGFPPETCGGPEGRCAVHPVELDGAAPEEWLVVIGTRGWSQVFVYHEAEAGRFEKLGTLYARGTLASPEAADTLVEALRRGELRAVPPAWRDVVIGGQRYRLGPP